MTVPSADQQQAQRLLEIINGSWMSRAAHVTAKIGLADVLAGGPKSCAELAKLTECNERALHQFLRGLCSIEICKEREDGAFEITAMGRMLGKNASPSLHSWATYWGESGWPAWMQLYEAVKTGTGMRERMSGGANFNHLQRDPRTAEIFNNAMLELTRLMAADSARAYDFGNKRVADIGGGYGELLANILEVHPTATGVLFDMEHAVADAQRHFTSRGLASRCEFVTGDFFESVPAGLDVYVLKSVIHDWNDERAKTILQTCRRAMTPQSRLLLLERLMPEKIEPTREHRALARSDLHMLVVLGAHERTEAEFSALLRSAGLGNVRRLPAAAGYWYMEASPA
jgi:ubiquinone/menaquinone biosynthesis C-methylase UbiE